MSSGWNGNEYCVLCATGDHDPSEHEPESALVITSIPGRKGKYLSIQTGSAIKTVARFRSGQASQELMDWFRRRNGRPVRVVDEQDDEAAS